MEIRIQDQRLCEVRIYSWIMGKIRCRVRTNMYFCFLVSLSVSVGLGVCVCEGLYVSIQIQSVHI